MLYPNIMVDLETTGTNPVNNAVVQLSGVRFNIEERAIDMNFFDKCLSIPGNRYWCENTRDWWGQQDPKIIDSIWSRMQDPRWVFQEFNKWAPKDLDGQAPTLWAKPSHFEFPFIESYTKEYGMTNPFFYRNVEDLNSWCRARNCPDLDKEVEFEGDAHNAIHDVLHQIKVLFELLDRTEVTLK